MALDPLVVHAQRMSADTVAEIDGQVNGAIEAIVTELTES
jgi:hypothetical protein